MRARTSAVPTALAAYGRRVREAGKRRAAVGAVAVAAATVGSVVLFAAPAYAATSVFKSGASIVVNATQGHANNITLRQVGANLLISDTGDVMSPGLNCFVSGNSIACPLGAQDTVVVNAGDLNDTITKLANVRGNLKGESGNDTINGGTSPGSNILDGGSGTDRLNGGSTFDFLIGGPGADRISGGGSTGDLASYTLSTSRVIVDLDGVADDGSTGEGDNVLADVEGVYGSQFNDVITGNAAANVLAGFGGNDTFFGGAGNDVLAGFQGDDSLFGQAGDDTLDTVDQVAGNDLTDGGTNIDTCRTDLNDRRVSCEH